MQSFAILLKIIAIDICLKKGSIAIIPWFFINHLKEIPIGLRAAIGMWGENSLDLISRSLATFFVKV